MYTNVKYILEIQNDAMIRRMSIELKWIEKS